MTTKHTHQIDVEWDDKLFTFDVTYMFWKGDAPYITPSAHDEPAMEDDFEILSVFYQGNDVTSVMSGSEMEDIAQELYEQCLQEFLD